MIFDTSSAIGLVFNRLTVLRFNRVHKTPCGSRRYYYDCLCSCGNISTCSLTSLRSGNTKSCGCYQKEQVAFALRKEHKHFSERFYRVWAGMVGRCTNINNKSYCDYGGRGIVVCESWLNFDNFFKDMWISFEENLTLDRINVDGNYEMSNCRWILFEEQSFNKREYTNNTSGCTGVIACDYGYTATISKDGVRHYLGFFKSFEDAVRVRLRAENDLYGYIKTVKFLYLIE